jgi:hypothetical protein
MASQLRQPPLIGHILAHLAAATKGSERRAAFDPADSCRSGEGRSRLSKKL